MDRQQTRTGAPRPIKAAPRVAATADAGLAIEPANAQAQGPGRGGRSPNQARPGKPAPLQPASLLAPRRVDLVERDDTGQLYLRAYEGGHFYWQPVAGPADEYVDRGMWLTGREFHKHYWINLGSYRRRAGRYVGVGDRDSAPRAA